MQSTQITPTPVTPSETTPLPATPTQTTPTPTTPIQTQATVPGQAYWSGTSYDERMQRCMERRSHYQAAGVPVWGVLLIVVCVIALFGNLCIGIGWIFGLALGTWFVYLGVRHVSEGGAANWWLVGLGLLIGLGAISTGFLDKLVFPVVLIIVGLGIMAEYSWSHQNQNR